METVVKVNSKIHGALKEIAASTGMSIREVVELLVSQGLSKADKLGENISTDGDILANIQQRMKRLEKSNLALQTRLLKGEDKSDNTEDDEGEEDEGPTTITKEDLLNPRPSRRSAKPGELKEGQEYYCKTCLNERGKYVWLDPEEKPEACPECKNKIKWNGESSGGMGWIIAGVIALALLGGRGQ